VGSKNPRVLLVSPLPPPAGGISTWTHKYVEWADLNDVEVALVNIAVTGKRARRINAGRRLADEFGRTLLILLDLLLKLRGFMPDIVHLNTPCSQFGIVRDFVCAFIVRAHKIPLIVNYHCNIEDQVGMVRLSRFFLRKMSELACLNLVLNEGSMLFLQKQTKKEVEILPNFIEEDYVRQDDKHIAAAITTVVFVGHVQRTKGVIDIISVARHFHALTFLLAGPISDEIMQIEIPSNVSLLGPLDSAQVRELLLRSDFFLFPTYTEGFSNALLEAMAAGLPVITTSVGANWEMIEEFGGILVNSGDPAGIVSAITKISDIAVREKASQWNVKKVIGFYSREAVMYKLMNIYRAVLLK